MMIHVERITPIVKLDLKIQSEGLCHYSNAYILVKGTIIVTNTGTAAAPNNRDVIFKNCASFTDCISEINNTEINHAKDIDVVINV